MQKLGYYVDSLRGVTIANVATIAAAIIDIDAINAINIAIFVSIAVTVTIIAIVIAAILLLLLILLLPLLMYP